MLCHYFSGLQRAIAAVPIVAVLALGGCGGSGSTSETEAANTNNQNDDSETQTGGESEGEASISSGIPVLLFSDLISGPDTGLGDGLGSGVIVTLWGQHLGASQGASLIEYCDSEDVCRDAYVYYWKHADGEAPSGPANLFESHGMQEIAISIPDSANGEGVIRVTIGADTSALPFTVRSGSIYHVAGTGNDSNDGSFNAPWLTTGRVGHTQSGGTTAGPGSTVYFHGMSIGGTETERAIYFNNSAAASTSPDMNFYFVAYPGEQTTVSGQQGFSHYQVAGAAISKFRVLASNCTEIANGQRTDCSTSSTWGVQTDRWGRIVANYISDQPGRCASRYQAAISGSAQFEDNVSNTKILGNEIEAYGCYGSGALHHTTYMTIRSAPDNLQVDPWEFGWNYLHDNDAKSGIHQFDQDDGCGDVTGPLIIRNNVVINQAGPGIDIGSQCGWSMDAYIENNIIINAGRSVEWDGVDPDTSVQTESAGISFRDAGPGLTGTMYVRNNIIHGVGWDDMPSQGEGCLSFNGRDADNVSVVFSDNVCVNTRDIPFLGAGYRADSKLDNVSGSGNTFFYSGDATPTRAIAPDWDSAINTSDPLITINGSRVSVAQDSPLNGQSNTALARDIYGSLRADNSAVGAVEPAVD